jgi:GT2 family glycosyltransferase
VPAPHGSTARPQISVRVVTYNSAECLPLFLDSLGRQTGVTWEAYFFDSASADQTAALIQSSGLGELVRSEAISVTEGGTTIISAAAAAVISCF